jgi:hypothetical protein
MPLGTFDDGAGASGAERRIARAGLYARAPILFGDVAMRANAALLHPCSHI